MQKRYPLHHEDARPEYVCVEREEYERLRRKAAEYDRMNNGEKERLIDLSNLIDKKIA